MGQPNKIIYKIKKIFKKFRYGLVLMVLKDYLGKIGIEFTPFYWMKETIPENIPPIKLDNPEDYEFLFFGSEEIKTISQLQERGFIDGEYILRIFKEGKKCYGVKYKGEIAAFTWFNVEGYSGPLYPVKMKSNEAYLFDMYVLKPFRGKNLAPILRYKIYEVLKEMGRDTCYSITETFNTPSMKFKEKLNAQFVLMGLYVKLSKRFRRRWILKRY